MPKTFLEIAKEATNGQVMGEFLQSQIEVATLPHHDIRTAHAELRHLRQTVAKIAADHGLAILAAGTHPTADWGRSQQIRGRALRRGDGRSADDRPAQHAVRAARACRAAGPRRPGRRDDPHAALSAAVHRACDLLAVLALAADRAQGLSAGRLRRAAAHRRAGAVSHQGGVRRLCRCAGEGRRDAGFELHVVVDAALAQASDPGVARAGLPDPGGRLDRHRRAVALAGAQARPQSRSSTATSTPSPARSWSRTNGGRSATACTAPSSATTARSRSPISSIRWSTRPRPTPRRSAASPRLQRCRTIVGSGTSADAQMAVYEKFGKTEGRARALSAVTDWLAATTLQ